MKVGNFYMNFLESKRPLLNVDSSKHSNVPIEFFFFFFERRLKYLKGDGQKFSSEVKQHY